MATRADITKPFVSKKGERGFRTRAVSQHTVGLRIAFDLADVVILEHVTVWRAAQWKRW
jgi:hypothetical protein